MVGAMVPTAKPPHPRSFLNRFIFNGDDKKGESIINQAVRCNVIKIV